MTCQENQDERTRVDMNRSDAGDPRRSKVNERVDQMEIKSQVKY